MISFDATPETPSSVTSSTSSSLSSENPDTKGTLSFSELLSGIVTKKDDSTVLKDGALLLSLDNETTTLNQSEKTDTKLSKSDLLSSLLQGDDVSEEKVVEEPTTLNSKLTNTLSDTELKTLVNDAKNYLKDQITQTDGYKRSEVKELPQTLKGLSEAAKTYGIDISKITLEEVQTTRPELSSKDILKKQLNTTTQTSSDEVEETNLQEDAKTQNTATKEVKATPLFKAQTQTEHSTEQIVQSKMQSTEQKAPKTKADETLKLLLRGDKTSKSESGLTADFSVDSAKVIAPTAETESSKNLESLLKGDTQKDDTPNFSKTDGLNVSKADSLEVKMNEAKQMTKYLSQDVKTAIDDYKSPFTRVKVQLNPQNLGEIDLTIVQRGKNLHINLSSNNAAINALSMNANDLKVQLQNNGINNASLNFNNSSQGGEDAASQQQQQQQQHQQREQRASKEYNYFTNQDENEEILSSLEIVVPHYA